MARIMELFVIVNAACGIAAFLGVRFLFRRSKDKAKRGFDIIRGDEEEELTPAEEELKPLPPPATNRSLVGPPR